MIEPFERFVRFSWRKSLRKKKKIRSKRQTSFLLVEFALTHFYRGARWSKRNNYARNETGDGSMHACTYWTGEKLRFVEFSWPEFDKKWVYRCALGGDVGAETSVGWADTIDALTWRVFNFSRALRGSTFHGKGRRATGDDAEYEDSRVATTDVCLPDRLALPSSFPARDRFRWSLIRWKRDWRRGMEGFFSFFSPSLSFFPTKNLIIARANNIFIRYAKYFRFSSENLRRAGSRDATVRFHARVTQRRKI